MVRKTALPRLSEKEPEVEEVKVDSAVWEGGFLKLHTADVDARHFAYAFTPGEYEIKAKKSLRSLDSNAYAWTLIDKLAAATGVPSSEVYRRAVRDVGGNAEIVCIKAEAAPTLRKIWESRGLGRQTEDDISKLPGCVNVILYYGSSTFDTRQMSRMIDNLIQDAKAVGIETMPPDKLAALLGEWEGKREKNLKQAR